MADHPCSTCPLLDLGHVYPVGDARDPWRRMPRLFAAAERVLGRAMRMRGGSPSRLRLEKLMGHYCRVQRQKYGPCTKKRARICVAILHDALAEGARAPQGQGYAYIHQALKSSVNDERTHARMKATVIRPATADLPLPPITFRRVPAA